MSSLETKVLQQIRERGPLPFAAFMSLALYDNTGGYYASGRERTGWRGDFLTSPELDPSFGALWARAFREIWEASGGPAAFDIVEIGPGEGGFVAAVADALDDDLAEAARFRLVERTPALQERQRERLRGLDRVTWIPSIAELPQIEAGCIFANEVLDNLPVHVVEHREGRLWEVCVDAGDEGLTWVRRAPSNPELEHFLARTGMTLAEGARAEVTLAGESLVRRVADLLDKGAVIFVDYGAPASELAARRGTLVAYSSHGVDDLVLERPGEKDITAHANWTSVEIALTSSAFEVDGPFTQRDALIDLGAHDVDLSLRARHAEAVAAGRGRDAVRLLSRRQGLAALLDRSGLGGLGVVIGRRGIAPLPSLSLPSAS